MLVNNDGSSSGGFLQLGSSLPRNSELMPPSPVLENAQNSNVERKNRKEAAGNLRLYQGGDSTDEKTECYTRLPKKPTQEDNELILKSLKNNSVFYQLSEDQTKEIVSLMFLCHTQKDQYLFKQGDKAYAFFLIKSGRIGVEIDSSEKKELG